MKIVHICLSGLYMDGWSYQDNLIAKYNRLDGHDVTVIANRYVYDEKGNYKSTDVTEETDRNDVKIIRLAQKGHKVLAGPAKRVHYIGLYETLERLMPDIIFLHNPQIMDVEEIIKYLKKSTDTKLFVDSHSDYSNSARNFISKHILHGILWRNKVQKLVPYTEKFFGVLPARVDFLIERYHTPKEKTELLVMGMDDELAEKAKEPGVKEGIREKLGVASDDFLIVTGGKIDSAKKQTLLLLDAVRQIDNPKVKLVVFGSVTDELKEEFLSKCDLLLDSASNSEIKNNNYKTNQNNNNKDNFNDPHTIYIGWLDADDTYPYFEAADLVVFPGRHSVMWEQVAGQGIPMVCKYWEGTTHVDIGGNVKFLYKDSVGEIKETILELIDKGDEYNEMRSMAKKGQEVFSYRVIAKKATSE